jgi:hypothetical protein
MRSHSTGAVVCVVELDETRVLRELVLASDPTDGDFASLLDGKDDGVTHLHLVREPEDLAEARAHLAVAPVRPRFSHGRLHRWTGFVAREVPHIAPADADKAFFPSP